MNDTSPTLAQNYLDASIADFKRIKRLAEKAFEQLHDEDYRWTPDGESNSIAVLIKHLGGNMVSRWTDFLATDGENPDRARDGEFVDDVDTRKQLMEIWERGWSRLFGTLESLGEEELLQTIHIRGEAHSVVEAISRQLWHYSLHVGQILYIAKHRRGTHWKSLSIPRGQSEEYVRSRRGRRDLLRKQ